jgi:hypothetical protein
MPAKRSNLSEPDVDEIDHNNDCQPRLNPSALYSSTTDRFWYVCVLALPKSCQ